MKTTAFYVALMTVIGSTVSCSSDDDSGGTSSGGTSSGGTSSGGTSSGGSSSGGASSGGSAGSGTGGASTGGASGSGSGGTAGLPGTFGETACMQCVVGECAAEVTACNADTACKQNLDCVLACPPKNTHEADETCSSACGELQNNAALAAFGACYKDAVDNACAVPCD